MPVLNFRNQAEASDALATLTAAAAGLAALIQSVNVIEVFVRESTAELLGYVQMAGVIVIFVVFAPMLILLKRRGGKAAGQGAGGSYFSVLLRQASSTAFSVTFAFMMVLSFLERTVLAHLSAETAVDLLISFALAMFALSFFLIDRFGHLGGGAGADA
jgi:hypothetical protein